MEKVFFILMICMLNAGAWLSIRAQGRAVFLLLGGILLLGLLAFLVHGEAEFFDLYRMSLNLLVFCWLYILGKKLLTALNRALEVLPEERMAAILRAMDYIPLVFSIMTTFLQLWLYQKGAG